MTAPTPDPPTEQQLRDTRGRTIEAHAQRRLALKLGVVAWMVIVVAIVIASTIPTRVEHRTCAPKRECVTMAKRPVIEPSALGLLGMLAASGVLVPGVLLSTRIPIRA